MIPKRRWPFKLSEARRQYLKKMRLEQPEYPFIYRPTNKYIKTLPKIKKLRGKHKKNKEQVRIYFYNRRRTAECRRTGKPLDYLKIYLPWKFNYNPRILNNSWVKPEDVALTISCKKQMPMPPRRTGIFSER